MRRLQTAQLTLATGLHAGSPLTLWLRVPLRWYTSATFAQFPDETRASIQRAFASPSTSDHRRVFCGYCGTPLSSWNERTRDDAEHISLPVGSLLDDDQNLLGELGVLPHGESSDDDTMTRTAAQPSRHGPAHAAARPEPWVRGSPWFEDMVQHTRLGRFKQQRGRHEDGRVLVEWEITEWTEGDDADDERLATPSKRKIGQVEAAEDSEMPSV
jgi:hypothetical protein